MKLPHREALSLLPLETESYLPGLWSNCKSRPHLPPVSSNHWLTFLRLTGLNFETVPGVQWLRCASQGAWKGHCFDGRREPSLTRISKESFQLQKLAVLSRNNFTSAWRKYRQSFHLFQTVVRDIELLCRKKYFPYPVRRLQQSSKMGNVL